MPSDNHDPLKDPTILERAKMQWVQRAREGAAGPPPRSIQPESIERYGESVWVLPDGDRHERRIQRAVLSGSDRLFWVTLTIACGAPRSASSKTATTTVEKKFGALAKARNDLDALHQYYRPMAVGAAEVIVPHSPGLGKSPGFFEWSEALDNPTRQDLEDAFRRVQQWLATNQSDPEYTSFQFNLCFSGHAEMSDTGAASLVIADESLEPADLTALLLRSIPPDEEKPAYCRLDLFLDCCHSGAVAQAVAVSLLNQQEGVDPEHRSVLRVGQVYCACLDDEDSFELAEIANSVFTFAFLNECSRKQPDGANATNLGLRDVGWYTEGRQHPVLIDFTVPDGLALKFPSQYYLTNQPRGLKKQIPASHVCVDARRLCVDPIGESLRIAQEWRKNCAPIEQALWADAALRKPFSRDELLTNKRFPFL